MEGPGIEPAPARLARRRRDTLNTFKRKNNGIGFGWFLVVAARWRARGGRGARRLCSKRAKEVLETFTVLENV